MEIPKDGGLEGLNVPPGNGQISVSDRTLAVTVSPSSALVLTFTTISAARLAYP